MLKCLLVNGQIPQEGINVTTGIIVILALASVVLGFILKLRALRKEDKEATEKTMLDRERTIRKEIEIDTILRDVKQSMDRLAEAITCLRSEVGGRIDKVEKQVDSQGRAIVKVQEAVKAAHRRMDEHRKVDHGLSNHQYYEVEEISDMKEGWDK